MQNVTLANILLKIDDFTADYPSIYYTTRNLRVPATGDTDNTGGAIARVGSAGAICGEGEASSTSNSTCGGGADVPTAGGAGNANGTDAGAGCTSAGAACGESGVNSTTSSTGGGADVPTAGGASEASDAEAGAGYTSACAGATSGGSDAGYAANSPRGSSTNCSAGTNSSSNTNTATGIVEGTARYVDAEDCLEFRGGIDFGTYFNALSLAKWMRYTVVRSFWLHLELAGDAALVLFTELTGNADAPRSTADILAIADASESYVTYDIELPISFATLVAFSLETYGTTKVRNAYYYTKVAESSIRKVDIALCTTTFRKEDYVIPNIWAIRRSVLESTEPIAQHFHLFVVDNGRTLDADALELNPQQALKNLGCSGADATSPFSGITVIPNPNVGGAGGFARGMMAALDAGATHALLMDDDVRVSPESFKRTFSLLSLLNDRYKDAFLNGAMLALEAPNMQYEDVAYIRRVTTYERVKDDIRIDSPVDIVSNERIDVEVPNAYGAWWFCCIPTRAIRKHGLPLPLFVRGDDVEYGMRCKPTIMTMSGICVWHAQFEGRWRSSIDCYQFQRNFRIAMACDDECDEFWYMFFFRRAFYSALRGLNYHEAELLLDALEDYTKGPSFLENAPANDLFMEKGRKNERLVPIDELQERDPAVMTHTARPNMEKALHPKATTPDKLVWYAGCLCAPLPFNLHMLPDRLLRDEPFGVYYTRPMVPLEPTMRRRTLVAFDADGTTASIRTLDRARYAHIMNRWRHLLEVLRTRGPKIEQSWRKAQPYLTSREFWESYLTANQPAE